ncbi:MAG: hypothetical protein AAF800_01545 [Planctomycetota bacterium]
MRLLRPAGLLVLAVLLLAGFWPVPSADAARGEAYVVAAGRSPIPQRGETFDQPIPAPRLDGGAADRPPAPDGPVPWGQAHRYVGQRIVVTGKVVNTYNHRGDVCFLNFHEDWRGKFYIPVFDEVFADLPEPPEDYFVGKTIAVRGTVTLHRNRPNIEVNSIRQVRVLD